MSALLYRATGSLTAVNCYSLVLAIAAIFVFARLLDRSLGVARRSLVLAGFAFNPLVLVNSSALIEWMQMTLLVVILLASAKAWLDCRRPLHLFGYGLSSALLVLTRPDAAVMCVAVLLALLWHAGLSSRYAVQLAVSNLVAGAATAAIFVAVNHGIDFIHGYEPTSGSVLRRFGVATMGIVNVFGPLGTVVVTLFAFDLARRSSHGQIEVTWWGRLFLVTAPLFVVRFIMEPAKLEYILPLVVVGLLAVAHERLALPRVAIVVFSMVLTSTVCVSLFKRTAGVDRITVAIDVNPGALAQDWQVTRHYRLVNSQRFLDELGDLVYAGEPVPRPRLRPVNFAIGVLSDANDLIIGEEQLYQLDNQRFRLPRFRRATYRRIYVCDGSIAGFKPGWRVWQRPPTLPSLDPTTGHLRLHCRQEGSRSVKAADVSPNPQGIAVGRRPT